MGAIFFAVNSSRSKNNYYSRLDGGSKVLPPGHTSERYNTALFTRCRKTMPFFSKKIFTVPNETCESETPKGTQ
jgi:hypothetical protein